MSPKNLKMGTLHHQPDVGVIELDDGNISSGKPDFYLMVKTCKKPYGFRFQFSQQNQAIPRYPQDKPDIPIPW